MSTQNFLSSLYRSTTLARSLVAGAAFVLSLKYISFDCSGRKAQSLAAPFSSTKKTGKIGFAKAENLSVSRTLSNQPLRKSEVLPEAYGVAHTLYLPLKPGDQHIPCSIRLFSIE